MNTTALRHSEADRPLTEVISSLRADDWNAASPCEGWTARDVVAHLVDTQREFLTGRGLDVGERPDLGDAVQAWTTHAARVARILADDTTARTPFDGYFGPSTIGATFERFYVWDMLVHRWDLARSAGLDAWFTDTELDRIEAGIDGFGDSLYMEGICAPAVPAPEDADRLTRVLARLGRNTTAPVRG